MSNKEKNKIIVFESKAIRSIWHNDEWWFAVIDVIEVLSESKNPRRYWSDLKRKIRKEGYSQLYEKIVQLKVEVPRWKDEKDRPRKYRNNVSYHPIYSLPQS